MNDDNKTLIIKQITATALTSSNMNDTNQLTSRKMSVAEGKVSGDRTSHNHDGEMYCAADECTDAAVTTETKQQREHKPAMM